MQSLNNPNIIRLRAPKYDNYFINWRNVSYFDLTVKDGVYTACIRWKYKAAIIEEQVVIGEIQGPPAKHFKRYQLVPLGQEVFININKVLLVQEEPVENAVDKVKVRIVFTDGFQLIKKMDSEEWSNWKRAHG